MQFSNYPAGVSDSHPYFNPPEVMQVVCGSEESVVVPSFKVKEHLNELDLMITGILSSTTDVALMALPDLMAQLKRFRDQVEELEDNGSYACPWEGEVEPEMDGGSANWDCPVCGETNQTIVEDDEPDPDRARDEALDRAHE